VCSTGIGDTVCRGCKRYADEVIHWNSYGEAEKRAVIRRLDQLLAQVMDAKLAIVDPQLLESRLQASGVRYPAHRSPHTWLLELLRVAASQIGDSRDFGFEIEPGYHLVELGALRQQIEHEYYLLSEAHYQRYVSPA